MSIEEIYQTTAIDPWFLFQLEQIFRMEQDLSQAAETDGRCSVSAEGRLSALPPTNCPCQGLGFSDYQIAHLTGVTEKGVERARKAWASGRFTSWWTPVRRNSGRHALLLFHL
jgi:carbamoyl-phosphate synthase large subunit